MDAAGSVDSMESFDNENEDKRTQQAGTIFECLQPHTLLLVHASGNFVHLIKAVPFDIVEMFRCYPLRCRGRLLRLLRCSTMRTIKLSTFERSVLVLPEITKLPNPEESLKKNISKVGTIVRSLGHCPSESQLQEVQYINIEVTS